MNKVAEMIRIHMSGEKLVYKYIDDNGKVIYMLKSIKGVNQSYNVIFENDRWFCDCPAFKFKSGCDKDGYCKHIQFVRFLLDNDVEIEVV